MLTDEEIERRAAEFRKELGISSQLQPDMMTVIQKTKRIFKRFAYRRVSDREMPNEEAQWDSQAAEMRIRESVFRAMQRSEARARMTIAHELAHFVLKHSGVRNRSSQLNAAEKYLGPVKRDEREAKRFAAAFLAPAELIKDNDTVQEIAARFGISTQAAEIRLSEVKDMRRRAAGHTRDLPPTVIDFLSKAQRRGAIIKTKLD